MGRKKVTASHFDYKNRLKERDLMRIGDFKGRHEKTIFQCLKCQHQWEIIADSIRRYGCPKCAGNAKLDQLVVRQKLKNRNIKLLDDVKGANHNNNYLCLICGKEWEAPLLSVYYHKTKCPKCSNKERLNDDIVKERVKDRDLILIGNIKRSNLKTEWECKRCKNRWSASPNCILSGHGCPYCAENPKANQRLTYQYLKELLPNIFIKEEYMLKEQIKIGNEIIRTKLFIDFYFEKGEKKCFVEYNGRQHYQLTKRFHKADELRKIKIRDSWLKDYCQRNNIFLITIDGRIYRGKDIKKYLEIILS